MSYDSLIIERTERVSQVLQGINARLDCFFLAKFFMYASELFFSLCLSYIFLKEGTLIQGLIFLFCLLPCIYFTRRENLSRILNAENRTKGGLLSSNPFKQNNKEWRKHVLQNCLLSMMAANAVVYFSPPFLPSNNMLIFLDVSLISKALFEYLMSCNPLFSQDRRAVV